MPYEYNETDLESFWPDELRERDARIRRQEREAVKNELLERIKTQGSLDFHNTAIIFAEFEAEGYVSSIRR